jgi:hypothetical protein
LPATKLIPNMKADGKDKKEPQRWGAQAAKQKRVTTDDTDFAGNGARLRGLPANNGDGNEVSPVDPVGLEYAYQFGLHGPGALGGTVDGAVFDFGGDVIKRIRYSLLNRRS